MNKERDNCWKNKAVSRGSLLKTYKKELARRTARAEKWRELSLAQQGEITFNNLIIKDLEKQIKTISDDSIVINRQHEERVRGSKV